MLEGSGIAWRVSNITYEDGMFAYDTVIELSYTGTSPRHCRAQWPLITKDGMDLLNLAIKFPRPHLESMMKRM